MARKRKVGWTDESITGSFNDQSKERRYRGKKGETHVIRVMTECEEYRVHAVDDVLEADKEGEPRVFNMNCSKTWDDDGGDWAGECAGCEREYDLNSKYVAGVLHLATYKGRAKVPQKIDPSNAVHYWDFGADKYRKLSDIAELREKIAEHRAQVVEATEAYLNACARLGVDVETWGEE